MCQAQIIRMQALYALPTRFEVRKPFGNLTKVGMTRKYYSLYVGSDVLSSQNDHLIEKHQESFTQETLIEQCGEGGGNGMGKRGRNRSRSRSKYGKDRRVGRG